MTIERFGKDSPYFFMSSMAPVPGGIETDDGVRVPTAEHDYQAGKFEDPELRVQIYEAEDGYEAKKVAKRLENNGAHVREDWEEVRIDRMRNVVAKKFANGSRLAHLLIETGNEKLVEGNTWDDTFWGVSPPGSHNGQNWLGRILMERRRILREDPDQK